MHRQVSIAFEGIDSETPRNVKLCAKYTRSFAYYTIKDRHPVILTKVIDDLSISKEKILKQFGQGVDEDLKLVIGQVSKLKNEVVTNKCLIKFCPIGDDVEEWNNFLDSLNNLKDGSPSWYYSPWLYVECYLYRRLWEIFKSSKMLQEYDPFENQKENAFKVSLPNAKLVSDVILQVLSQTKSTKQDFKKNFIEILKLSLWSNKCDLSLLNETQLSEGNFNFHNLIKLDSFLLSDDSENVFNYLASKSNGVIDFVTDNASYEVFCDFCFCDLLCSASLVSKVRFHVKKMPWFVSDVTIKDINWLLNELEKEGMEKLAKRWKNYFQDGTWTVSDEKYWTLPFDYSDMKSRDCALYDLFKTSNLIIFKGDLNYRKLLGEINWDPLEKFQVAIREFKPTSVLALRTVKCDLISGLTPEKYGQFSQDDKMWMRTGDYGLIQFYHHI